MTTIGVDEVGRGSWAGPLVVVAVSAETTPLSFAIDSKQLTAAQRQRSLLKIQQVANQIGIGWVSNQTIDELGLSTALTIAARKAISQFSQPEATIILDGPFDFLKNERYPVQTITKADTSVPQVAAASIVAKVLRDSWMSVASQNFPLWGFSTNKGYGTLGHRKAIKQHGASGLHRLSFRPLEHVKIKHLSDWRAG